MSMLIKADETLLGIYFGLTDIKQIYAVILDELSYFPFPELRGLTTSPD